MNSATDQTPPVAPPCQPFGAMDDKTYAVYREERGKLLDTVKEQGRTYDKYLLTLSGGALGLSLTFIREIVPVGRAHWVWLVALAWLGLLAVILMVLRMMRLSQDGHETFVSILDEEAPKGGNDYWKRVRARQGECVHRGKIGRLNCCSLWTFGAALVLLFAFTVINLSASIEGSEMKHKPAPDLTTHGVKPTLAPVDQPGGTPSHPPGQAGVKPPLGPVDHTPPPPPPPAPTTAPSDK